MAFSTYSPALILAAFILALCQIASANPIPGTLKSGHELEPRQNSLPPITPTTPFAKVSGRHFSLDGGATPAYLTGINAYWASYLRNNADTDAVFKGLQDDGIKVVRIWGFNELPGKPSDDSTVYFQVISNKTTTFNEGPNGLDRLDYTIKSAAQHGIRLVIPLVNGGFNGGFKPDVGALNNGIYDTSKSAVAGFGGSNLYQWAWGYGQDGPSQVNWFFDNGTDPNAPSIQAAYQKYAQHIVTRYKDDPTIFAWELCNECRCHGCANDVIFNWAKATSALIKQWDPNHMVAFGDEGWLNGDPNPQTGPGGQADTSYPYNSGEGVDFDLNLGIAELDYGSFHLYPDNWAQPSQPFGSKWIADHDLLGSKHGKPVVLEEYGALPGNARRDGNGTSAVDAVASWQATLINGNIKVAMDQIWQYGDSAVQGQLTDVFTLQRGSLAYQTLVVDHAVAMAGRTDFRQTA